MAIKPGSLNNFTCRPFTFEGVTYDTYRRGVGPGVIIMHEIPNLSPEVLGLAERIADNGFHVVVPSLMGKAGAPTNPLNLIVQAVRACIRKEFMALAADESGAIVPWLRALCREIYGEIGGRGIGAIGLCLTGNFALALTMDPEGKVVVPVMSEPSLPFPLGGRRRAALHLSPTELTQIKQRIEAENITVLGLRFTNDWISPCQRFVRLHQELGDHFDGIQIDSTPGNADGIKPTAHSVLTLDLIDTEGHPTRQALERVLQLLHERLD